MYAYTHVSTAEQEASYLQVYMMMTQVVMLKYLSNGTIGTVHKYNITLAHARGLL
jgi:hypothetical protein